MADKVFLRFSLVLCFVFMSSGWLAASTENVGLEAENMEIDPEGELCQLLNSVFTFTCGNETTPGKVCRLFGKFLTNICMIPCIDVAQHSLCVPSPLCMGGVLPYGYCPKKFVCCLTIQKLQYQKQQQQQQQQQHRSQQLR